MTGGRPGHSPERGEHDHGHLHPSGQLEGGATSGRTSARKLVSAAVKTGTSLDGLINRRVGAVVRTAQAGVAVYVVEQRGRAQISHGEINANEPVVGGG